MIERGKARFVFWMTIGSRYQTGRLLFHVWWTCRTYMGSRYGLNVILLELKERLGILLE